MHCKGCPLKLVHCQSKFMGTLILEALIGHEGVEPALQPKGISQGRIQLSAFNFQTEAQIPGSLMGKYFKSFLKMLDEPTCRKHLYHFL